MALLCSHLAWALSLDRNDAIFPFSGWREEVTAFLVLDEFLLPQHSPKTFVGEREPFVQPVRGFQARLKVEALDTIGIDQRVDRARGVLQIRKSREVLADEPQGRTLEARVGGNVRQRIQSAFSAIQRRRNVGERG